MNKDCDICGEGGENDVQWAGPSGTASTVDADAQGGDITNVGVLDVGVTDPDLPYGVALSNCGREVSEIV